MAKHLIVWTALCGLLAGLLLGGASPGAQAQALTGTTGERLWYHEAEFAVTPGLRAQPHQVVILHLAPGTKARKPRRHTIPYLFAEEATFNFCVPTEDPHIRALELVREDSHSVVMHVPRGAPCKTRTIAAGRYQLRVDHDGTGIPAAGKKAFVHVPRLKGNLQEGGTLSSFPSACDPNPYNNPTYTFTAPNGQYVNLDFWAVVNGNNSAVKLYTTATPDAGSGWNICPDSSGNVTLVNNLAFTAQLPVVIFSSGPPNTDAALYYNFNYEFIHTTPTPFKLTDLGNGQFTLAANFSGTLYPIVVGSDNVLHWATPGTPPAVFTTVVKFYSALATTPQPLVAGEAALFQACNYELISGGGMWVFTGNIPAFGVFQSFDNPFDNTIASIQFGPQTSAIVFPDPNYGGQVQTITEDTPCLSGTPIGSGASSIKITPSRQFISSTNACQNCYLSGVDLSNLDLSGGQFQGSTFTGANLSGTILQSASLDYGNITGENTVTGATTQLTGTNFVGALLRCTNFSGADLSQATFQSGTIKPIVTTDFSCRLDLTDAILNVGSFPLTQWRYANLTGATINGAAGAILSTKGSPLELSGAILNHTNLHGALLDSAILGCVSPDEECTQLIETSLTNASLTHATLVHALLQGANLDFANLDGANLCEAQLNKSTSGNVSATLQGAFLRNVNLATADLTGANLTNANFYSTSAPDTCNSSASCTSPPTSCASAVKATLNNAVFTGAYLNGVDFSGSTPQSADFSGASLAGSIFTGANLSQDSGSGKRTDFTGALLQGTTFTNANVTGAIFTNAVVDLTSSSQDRFQLVQLDAATHIAFPGYKQWAGSTLGCVEFDYNDHTQGPPTNTSNQCPDGNDGPCTTAQWQAATPPPLPASCSQDTEDFNWFD